jgi:hypothetical protein
MAYSKEEQQAYDRAYRAKNREKCIERTRKWRHENAEHMREYHRKRYQAKRDHILEVQRQRLAAKPEYTVWQNMKQRCDNPIGTIDGTEQEASPFANAGKIPSLTS